MIANNEYTEYNYNHLCDKIDFGFDYSNKLQSKYESECISFKRVSILNENENNFNCNRLDDLCHLCICRHPPRIERNDKIMKSYNKLFENKNKNEKKKGDNVKKMKQFVSTTTIEESSGEYCDVNDLIYELISNGFENDLCLNSEDFKNHYKKVFNYRRALMLSSLYSGCCCNYDLCEPQRQGNYEKWKCFDD